MILRELLFEGKNKLKNSAIDSFSLDAELLLAFALNYKREELFYILNDEAKNESIALFNNLIDRRIKKEPISHIIGKRYFWDLEFIVNENVLDPRPDTETMIEAVLKYFPDRNIKLNILDLGVGSGTIILTLLYIYKNSKGIATDINEKSLEISRLNAKKFGIEDRINFLNTSWNDKVVGDFDIIVSNPPYIKTKEIDGLQDEVKIYEPKLALDGGADGLDCYREIASKIAKNTKDNTKIFLEIGCNQEKDIESIFLKNGFKLMESFKDLSGIVRVLYFN